VRNSDDDEDSRVVYNFFDVFLASIDGGREGSVVKADVLMTVFRVDGGEG
jgi:hypothetical protein